MVNPKATVPSFDVVIHPPTYQATSDVGLDVQLHVRFWQGQGRAAGTDGGVSDKKVVGFPLEGQPQQQSYSENVAPYYAAGSTGNSVASLSDHSQRARRSGGEGGDTSRVRGFHDMICVGFAVSLCLNLGSLTARKEGFFAAQVLCLPEGASETILVSPQPKRDL